MMLFANLKTSLKDGVKPAYLLAGSDVFLINKAIELITDAAGTGQFGVTKLDDSAVGSEVVAKCRTVSMFGGRRAVIVRPVGEKLFDKILSGYLASPDTECVLILVCDKAAGIKNIEAVDCNPMSEDLVMRLAVRNCQEYGKKLTDDAARLLARFCGNNFSCVNNELGKLVHYFDKKQILDAADVDEIAVRGEEYQVYELSNAVLRKDVKASKRILDNLIESGVEDYAIFAGIAAAVRRTFWAICTKVPAESISVLFKCHPYAIVAARRDYAALSAEITGVYSAAADLEYRIKSGKISVMSAIMLFQGLFF